MWSKIALAGLLISTLQMSGQPQSAAKREALKMEVDREVARIKKVVKRLKIAKIAIPSIIAGAGIAATALAAAVVAVLFFVIPGSNVSNFVKRLERNITKKRKFAPLSFHKILQEKLGVSSRFFKAAAVQLNNVKPGSGVDAEVMQKIVDVLKQELRSLKFIAAKGAAASASAIVVVLVGFIGTTTISIGTFFGLSAASVAAAFKSAQKLERIKKEHPGILMPQQESFLVNLKKLSRNIITKAIIKNLRLKDALATAAYSAIRQYPHLVAALGGPKKARKSFSIYIKLKWKEALFEKALREGANVIKTFVVKLQLKSTKKKLKKLEKRYSQLKASLKNAVQTYQMQANGILQELQKDLLESAEKKELKPEMRLQPVVPL